MRRAWASSASTAFVIRETSGFSVRPTVRESILNARRRNSEATRVSTPGLFSTYTTYVFSIFSLFVGGSLHDLAGPPDHLVQRRPGRHHRIHRVLLFYPKVDQDRTIMLPRRLYRGHDLRAFRDGHTANAIRLAQFGEIGIEQRRRSIVALVEKLLPLPHHAEKTVVDDGDVHLQIFLHNGRQFAQRHLKAAIADHHPHFRLRARHLR